MSRPTPNLSGMVFGRLTVFSRADNDTRNKTVWNCVCVCGTKLTVAANRLQRGNVQSCGCLQKEVISAPRVHGHAHTGKQTREYRSWQMMKNRCYNEKYHEFEYYGGRGITVCKRWRDSFESFLLDMGPRPAGCSLEREKTNRGYSPSNCKWADRFEQANNKRNNVFYKLDGELKTLPQWSRDARCVVSLGALTLRVLRRGWGLREALTTASKKVCK